MSTLRQRISILRPLALLAAVLIGGLLWGRSAAFPNHLGDNATDSPLVLRVYYEDIRDLSALQAYDLWEYNNVQEHYVLLSADLVIYRELLAQGWMVTIDEAASQKLALSADRLHAFFGDYRTVDQLYADVAALAAASPTLTEVVDYGQSYCLAQGGCTTPGGDSWAGFPLLALRLTNENVPGSSTLSDATVTRGAKPIFFLMAGIHSREITTPELAMRFAEELLGGYGVDADATWLIDYHEIWIVPTANPDGHWLVELGATGINGDLPFFQRKNANNDVNGDDQPDCSIWPPSSFAQFGIDLNRNHSFGWGPPGSSDGPCDMTYRGPSAASESETAALETLIAALYADRRGPDLTDPAPADTPGMFITLHSFGDLVLWPWGHIADEAPNKTDLKAIGDKFAAYNGYLSCQPSACLYASNGASDDYAYGELGVPAYTFEIGDEGDGFMPPYNVIDDEQWPDNAPALRYAAKIARTPYLTIHGPDVLDPAITNMGQTVIVTATLDDTGNGGNPIAGGQYTIDTPPWIEGVTTQPLEPADGSFGAAAEPVETEVVTDGLTAGKHMLFLRGQDADENWGPVSAVFFEVVPDLAEHLYLPAVLDR